jgi:hypothetical protein
MAEIKTFAEFWPFYLREHSKPATRAWHFAGTSCSLALIACAVVTGRPIFLLPALFTGYACAWYSHFFIEKNRPATFTYPFKSFISDWKMWALTLAGKLGPELERAGVR